MQRQDDERKSRYSTKRKENRRTFGRFSESAINPSLQISLSLPLPQTHGLSTYAIILFIKSPLRYVKIDLIRLLIIGITVEKEIKKKRYERSTDERKERTVRKREKKAKRREDVKGMENARTRKSREDRSWRESREVGAGGVMAGAGGGAATLWRLQRRDAPVMLAPYTYTFQPPMSHPPTIFTYT